jgi:uncharacterized cupredoxin-like copper-binding protein
MKPLTTLAVVIAILAIAPLGSGYANTTVVRVKGGEFFFRLSTKSIARPGTVAFTFKNVGHVVHDFKIDGKKTPLIQPGHAARLVVTFKRRGRYRYSCTVYGHAAAGMSGVFKVGA